MSTTDTTATSGTYDSTAAGTEDNAAQREFYTQLQADLFVDGLEMVYDNQKGILLEKKMAAELAKLSP